MKKFKILEFEGDWVELHKPIYTENTEKNIWNEVEKESQIGSELFDLWFIVIYDPITKGFFGMETERKALPPANFGLFLIFPNFLETKSWVERLYLWCIKPILKVPKDYMQKSQKRFLLLCTSSIMIQMFIYSLNFARRKDFCQKSNTKQQWWPPNIPFWLKLYMQNSVHRKLFNLNFSTTFLLYTVIEKGPWSYE